MVIVALPIFVPSAGRPAGAGVGEGVAVAVGVGVALGVLVGAAVTTGLAELVGVAVGTGATNPGGFTPRSYTLITAPEPSVSGSGPPVTVSTPCAPVNTSEYVIGVPARPTVTVAL